jgi:hypothetical protein
VYTTAVTWSASSSAANPTWEYTTRFLTAPIIPFPPRATSGLVGGGTSPSTGTSNTDPSSAMVTVCSRPWEDEDRQETPTACQLSRDTSAATVWALHDLLAGGVGGQCVSVVRRGILLYAAPSHKALQECLKRNPR